MKNKTPALRKSRRYLKFKIHSEEKIRFREVLSALKNSSREYMGLKELSEAQPWMIKNKFNEEKQEGVIRVQKGFEDDLRAAVLLVEAFNGKKGFFEVSEISGSLKSLS